MNRILEEGIDKLGLKVDDVQLGQLDIFLQEIMLFNPVYKLVSSKDEDEIVIRHFLDTLAGVPLIEENLSPGAEIADAGSGAGFPGMILSIMLKEHKVSLIERMQRRSAFLRNVLLRCNIENAEVVSSDLKETEGEYGMITCRAFHPLCDVLPSFDRILAPSGCIAAYKGRSDYVEAELEGESRFSYRIVPLRVPFLDEPRVMCLLRRSGDVR